MRISRSGAIAALALALLAACGKPSADPFGGASEADRIECRIGGAAVFTRECVVARASGPDGLVLTIRHPDGGFRRLQVTNDGRGVIAADGGEPAAVAVEGDAGILVTVSTDAYRLPATVKAAG